METAFPVLKCSRAVARPDVLQWGGGRSGGLEQSPLRGPGQCDKRCSGGTPEYPKYFSLVPYKSCDWAWRRVGGFNPPNSPVASPLFKSTKYVLDCTIVHIQSHHFSGVIPPDPTEAPPVLGL